MSRILHLVSGNAGLALLLAACLLTWSAPLQALRCGNSLVERGDSKYRVSQLCPAPFWVDRHEGPFLADAGYYPAGLERYEIWYLNFGPRRQMRRLTFLNGYVDREVELGYGFSGTPGPCSPGELERAGPSLAEVFAECGPPDQYESWPVTIGPTYVDEFGGHSGGPRRLVFNDTWIYHFGPNADIRILEFQDGRLIRLQRERP